eukprot:TRINITY_DN6598_c0_g1_i1.p1 TRINITY_DN6598_c0_g1~~TRINITY_DN6598_c0_g1_i1.p1  ORF type:complete len:317 (+),score=48.84 TRINITY_DN6598_c0_g1_i1:49-999(+)
MTTQALYNTRDHMPHIKFNPTMQDTVILNQDFKTDDVSQFQGQAFTKDFTLGFFCGRTALRTMLNGGIGEELHDGGIKDDIKVPKDYVMIDRYGNSPLSWAAYYGQVENIKRLVEVFLFRVNWQNNDGNSPLMLAVMNGHEDAVSDLLDYGANPNLRNKNGETALHYAACKGMFDVCKELVSNGAWLEAEDLYGDTPLHWAVRDEQKNVVFGLLESGANAYHRNEDDESPRKLAKIIRSVDILQVFDSYEMDMDDLSDDGIFKFSDTVEIPCITTKMTESLDDWMDLSGNIDDFDLGSSSTVIPTSIDDFIGASVD